MVELPDDSGLSAWLVIVAAPSRVEADAEPEPKIAGNAHRASAPAAKAARGASPPHLRIFIIVVPFVGPRPQARARSRGRARSEGVVSCRSSVRSTRSSLRAFYSI